MSADNGIYIGRFPSSKIQGDFEYRVIEAQAIENCDDDPNGKFPQWLTDAYIVLNYGNAYSFKQENEAVAYADKLYKETMRHFGVCEYGICHMEYPRPVKNISSGRAKEIMEDFFQDGVER